MNNPTMNEALTRACGSAAPEGAGVQVDLEICRVDEGDYAAGHLVGQEMPPCRLRLRLVHGGVARRARR